MTTARKRINSSYLHEVLDHASLNAISNKLFKILSKKTTRKFNAIACRGYSGCIVAAPLCCKLKKDLIIVRKDSSHSCCRVEGPKRSKRYIIIDDLISSGNTIFSILEDVDNYIKSECVGIYLYAEDRKSVPVFNMEYRKKIRKIVKSIPITWFNGLKGKTHKEVIKF